MKNVLSFVLAVVVISYIIITVGLVLVATTHTAFEHVYIFKVWGIATLVVVALMALAIYIDNKDLKLKK
jgi:hypothetical protein